MLYFSNLGYLKPGLVHCAVSFRKQDKQPSMRCVNLICDFCFGRVPEALYKPSLHSDFSNQVQFGPQVTPSEDSLGINHPTIPLTVNTCQEGSPWANGALIDSASPTVLFVDWMYLKAALVLESRMKSLTSVRFAPQFPYSVPPARLSE